MHEIIRTKITKIKIFKLKQIINEKASVEHTAQINVKIKVKSNVVNIIDAYK